MCVCLRQICLRHALERVEFAVCWMSQVPSWAKPNGNWIQSRMSGWHMIFTEIWHCLCKQHTLLPHSGNHLGFMCEWLKTRAGEHLMLHGFCDVFPTLDPRPWCPCICKHGSLSHAPMSSSPTEGFLPVLCSGCKWSRVVWGVCTGLYWQGRRQTLLPQPGYSHFAGQIFHF